MGDIQDRTRGTIGGSLAHADPNADLPAAVLALDAELVAQGPGGRRTIRARVWPATSSRFVVFQAKQAVDRTRALDRLDQLRPGAPQHQADRMARLEAPDAFA